MGTIFFIAVAEMESQLPQNTVTSVISVGNERTFKFLNENELLEAFRELNLRKLTPEVFGVKQERLGKVSAESRRLVK